MRDCVPLLLLISVTGIGTTVLAEEGGGQLKRARDEVRPKPAPTPPSNPRPPDHRPDHGHDHGQRYHPHGGGGWTLFGWFGVDAATSSDGGESGPTGLLAYPYADDQRGWFITSLDTPADPSAPASVRVRQVGGAIRGEYTDAGGDLKRYAGAVQVSFSHLRLESEWHRYIEHLPGDRTDTLTLGTIGLAAALPLENAITLVIGGGLSTYHDSIGTESGWYLKTGVEVFPIRPLIVSAEVWGGYIREDQFSTETFMGGGRATAGVIWNRIEVYGGWQAIWIESVTLDGPTVGLRVWF